MREVCRNMRNLKLLDTWIAIYTEKANAGVMTVDTAAQVSPRTENGDELICHGIYET